MDLSVLTHILELEILGSALGRVSLELSLGGTWAVEAIGCKGSVSGQNQRYGGKLKTQKTEEKTKEEREVCSEGEGPQPGRRKNRSLKNCLVGGST